MNFDLVDSLIESLHFFLFDSGWLLLNRHLSIGVILAPKVDKV